MNYLAPSGTPIYLSHLFKWLIKSLTLSNILDVFSKKIKKSFNIKHVIFISSGRTALYLLLQCLYELKDDKKKNQIIIPSYTCFSVPGSIEKANLQVRVCDIDPSTLSYNLENLSEFDFSNVLAIVTSNLYGIPNNLPDIQNIAEKNNVYLIDDAAQSLGGQVNNIHSGTFGDAGLYSLDKGKNITSIQGGIIVTNSDDIAKSMKKIEETLPNEKVFNILTDCIKLFIYSVMLPPNRYWVITKLPFLKLGLTPYTTDYPVHKYAPILGAIANLLYDDLATLTNTRNNNALELKKRLGSLPHVSLIEHNDNVEPVYLRLPILITNTEKRTQLIEALNNAGIGATASYPSSILGINEIKHKLIDSKSQSPGGEQVANQIVTLPTHSYMRKSHINLIESVFINVLS